MPLVLIALSAIAVVALIKDGPVDSRDLAIRPGERPTTWR